MDNLGIDTHSYRGEALSAGAISLAGDLAGPQTQPAVGAPGFEPFPASAVERPIVERFHAIARRYPESIAVADGTLSFSYRALAALAHDIAAAIVGAAGDRPGLIAILLDSEARYPAAMLGALMAGRGFIPLDAEHPIERNRLIAERSGAVAVVSAGGDLEALRSVFPVDTPIVDLDRLRRADPPLRFPALGARDVACVIYTSGSTGTPKGVPRDCRGLLKAVEQHANIHRIGSGDRCGMVFSPAVVAAMRNIFGALLAGASLQVIRPQELTPRGLVDAAKSREITVWQSVPTLFRSMVDALAPHERLQHLRIVNLVGDRTGWDDFDAMRRYAPDAALSVGLGSTECSPYCGWLVDPAAREAGGRLPIGRALPDWAIAIVDENGQAVSDGQVGEIVVGGPYVSLGYWRDPALTAEHFFADPLDPDARVFRTGDLGLRRPDGLLEFVGRKDHQFKLRGHRIEPGEVEGALRACSGVSDAAVVVRRNGEGTPRSFVVYVEPQPGVDGLLPRHVQAMLSRILPGHMMPSAVIVADRLPRLAGLKIDRLALAEIDAARPTEDPARRNDRAIDAVATIFESVLGTSGATADDNIASLGGDSLQAVEVIAALEARFGLAVPAERFAEAPSIRELAAWLALQRTARRKP